MCFQRFLVILRVFFVCFLNFQRFLDIFKVFFACFFVFSTVFVCYCLCSFSNRWLVFVRTATWMLVVGVDVEYEV